ncbi:phage holin family protein [Aeromicrobium sp. Root344]|uniref:phage holin family protein n=1 Tax=Aeromicrobium sp. Root344 TaxID=1736521 RepID=UPI000B1814D6|nr:phage holin family protein [Aeromicrobium sp. Root344]
MTGARTPTSEASTGELIAQATGDISTLIRNEIQLAKQDLATSGKRLGVGAGMFGVAGTLALYGLGALIAAAILGIAEELDAWLAALIVGGGLFVLAGLAALVGKMRVSRVAEPPKERVASVKADVAAARHGATS